ncbi:PepSY-associated TM helix domain-containing protein [Nibricoccus sp. IMCC34717]|uniref:PepSY-associated TM helix domain-containing protein n=1 Tax=Nibricoccus sp. IMCC34717 TaxID=3034021 RepID=UPI0038502B36
MQTTENFGRAVWRWHFLAGLFVAPFAIFLALTGAAYLWKPQYEAWRYRDLLWSQEPAASPLDADALFTAASRAMPGETATQFIPPPAPGRSAEVVFGSKRTGGRTSVFVDPADGAILGTRREADRLMTTIHDLHGTLLAGKPGEYLVELAASWAFVMLLTGFWLWWPRPFRWGGFLYPRIGYGKRTFFRDLHAVPAVWFSAFTLLLLATGMPWTKAAGAWVRQLAQWTGEWQPRETEASAHRSEVLGGWSPYLADQAKARQAEAVTSAPSTTTQPISLARVQQIATEQRVTDAYAIALPKGPTGVYSVLSDRNRAFTRTYLHLDQYSGRVLADVRYDDFGAIAKFFTFGIILHEGQLFGLANQLLGTLACFGVIAMAGSGLWLWWRRKPAGGLGVIPAGGRRPRWLIVATCACALFAPLLLGSLVLLWLIDRLFSHRIPFLR